MVERIFEAEVSIYEPNNTTISPPCPWNPGQRSGRLKGLNKLAIKYYLQLSLMNRQITTRAAPTARSVPDEHAKRILGTWVWGVRVVMKGGMRPSWFRRARLPNLPEPHWRLSRFPWIAGFASALWFGIVLSIQEIIPSNPCACLAASSVQRYIPFVSVTNDISLVVVCSFSTAMRSWINPGCNPSGLWSNSSLWCQNPAGVSPRDQVSLSSPAPWM